MLTVKEINDVSFGKAGFSGYKPEEVDHFIDEVANTVEALERERNDALLQVEDLSAKNSTLAAKNAELQQKLSILAQRIETYRAEEDTIKEAIIGAQRLAKEATQKAQVQAEQVIKEAQAEAQKIVDEARKDNYEVIQNYAEQVEDKKNELEEIKRQVSSFRASLMEMYKKHLECIDHIPSFRVKEQPAAPVEEPAAVQEEAKVESKDESETTVALEQETVIPDEPQEEQIIFEDVVAGEEEPEDQEEEVITYPQLHERRDYTREPRASERKYGDDDLSEVGIDLETYSDIPETLQREKRNNYSGLEFGDDVDLGNRRKKK